MSFSCFLSSEMKKWKDAKARCENITSSMQRLISFTLHASAGLRTSVEKYTHHKVFINCCQFLRHYLDTIKCYIWQPSVPCVYPERVNGLFTFSFFVFFRPNPNYNNSSNTYIIIALVFEAWKRTVSGLLIWSINMYLAMNTILVVSAPWCQIAGSVSEEKRSRIIATTNFFKQKTAYVILLCDWSSDVCSSDLEWMRD